MMSDKATKEENGETTTTTMLSIAVGSTNPAKIKSVKNAFQQAIRVSSSVGNIELEVKGYSVPSGVPDQPFGDEETQQGAKNRAANAYEEYKKVEGKYPHFAVGLEGGLEWSATVPDENDNDTLWCMAWMAVYGKRKPMIVDIFASKESKFYNIDKKPGFGLAKTASFLLPSSLGTLIREGMELGDADDKVFGRVNSKQGSGTVGVLTDNLIDRSAYYEHALILALVPWFRPDVYAGQEEAAKGLMDRMLCKTGGNK